MTTLAFAERPWGRLNLLGRFGDVRWSVLGALGTEPRSLCSLRYLVERDSVDRSLLLEVRDPSGHPQAGEVVALKDLRRTEVAALAPSAIIELHDLLEPYGKIVATGRAFAELAENLLIDVTALPNRYFLPLVRTILADRGPRNVVATYALGERYVAEEALHQDALPASPVPLFSPSVGDDVERPQSLVVGLGFEAPGLLQLLDTGDIEQVHFLFPFPSPPPFARNNWEFFRHVSNAVDPTRMTLLGVSSTDTPSVFEHIEAIADNGRRPVTLAPYGPKPVTLAMGLYAVKHRTASILYTQPKYYHPKYSDGVASDADGVLAYAYPLRLAGRDLY